MEFEQLPSGHYVVNATEQPDAIPMVMAMHYVVNELVKAAREAGKDSNFEVTAVVIAAAVDTKATPMPYTITVRPLVNEDSDTILGTMDVMDQINDRYRSDEG